MVASLKVELRSVDVETALDVEGELFDWVVLDVTELLQLVALVEDGE